MSDSLMDQMGKLMHAVDDTARIGANSPQVSLPELQVIVGRLAALAGRLCDVTAEVVRQADMLPERKILETSADRDSYQCLSQARVNLHECQAAIDEAHERATQAHDQLEKIRIAVDIDAAPDRRQRP